MCKIYSLWKVVFLSLLSFVVVQLALAQDIPVSPEEPQAPSEEAQRPAVVAFVNVNVVPMDRERILPQQTVIVRADRIREIGPVDTTDIPEGALRIDGRDKYLMPGLVDMHAHLPKNYQQDLSLFIANGVTTVRNMWGENYHLKLREEINKGKLIGPTIYTTGPIIDGYPPLRPNFVVAETPEQAAQLVAEHKKAGFDYIKVYDHLSKEVYDAIVEAAAKHEMLVMGHVPWAVGLEHALAAGQHSVEHLTGYNRFLQVEDTRSWQQIDETKIPHIAHATREAGTWNCPTLVLYQKRMNGEEAEQELKQAYMKYVPLFKKQWWLWSRRYSNPDPKRVYRMSNRKRMTKALHDAGARILLGTDTGVTGFALHQELRIFVDAGLTPYEAIKAGTHDAAECLGELDEFGTISPGLRADLILIEDNPLEDVGNAAKRIGVMARGCWFPQSELQAMLDALAIKHAIEENPDGVMLRGRWYPRTELEAMVDEQNERKKEELVEAILSSGRIFVEGSGLRVDELVARSVAMKLMQLGFRVYVAGDATTPVIEKGDLHIAISFSGRASTTYRRASAAKNSGAGVVLLTARSTPKIGVISDLVFILGPDFYEEAGLFVDELVTLITEKRRKN
jgi:imidazolonepropionase-like amidohydrolase